MKSSKQQSVDSLCRDGADAQYIRESVDSLSRDGTDVQYMQYLNKSRITSPQVPKSLFNPLTTNQGRHQISAACYQLAQSVLKIGSALAKRVGQGEVGGYNALPDSAWRLLQLAVEYPWLVLGGPLHYRTLLKHAGRYIHM